MIHPHRLWLPSVLIVALIVAQVALGGDVFNMGPGLTSLETVTVGNPGNANDNESPRDSGAVDYVYDIGTYEVTAAQYTEFLNAVGATDTYGLYNDYMTTGSYGCGIQRAGSAGSYTYSVASDWANRPVNAVSWGDAVRFANWLHNGQPTGGQNPSTTEDGSYLLNGAMTDTELMAVTRKASATWVLPSEDEWYKAAYYNGSTGSYVDYATGSDAAPSNGLIDPDPGNNANYHDGSDYTTGSPYYRTEVGEFENSDSYYGTFDQAGNVTEWFETECSPTTRGFRGGAWGYAGVGGVWDLKSDRRINVAPSTENFYSGRVGFRVAEVVPEPATMGLLALGGLAVLRRRRRGPLDRRHI